MSDLAAVRVTVTVAVDPDTAFDVFTGEIDAWYRRGVATMPRSRRNSTLHFEPGVGGRLVERRDGGGGEIERARVTVWERGKRLIFVDQKDTEVDVWFESTDDGTRVVLEHRGLDRLDPSVAADIAKYGWRRLADWFETHVKEQRS
jgi:hypothetical protein